jgi:hypothetical protein
MSPAFRAALLVLLLVPILVRAQFTDDFTTLDPAWTPNRHDSAGFEPVFFDGDNRLRLTLAGADSAANRPVLFSSSFYDLQGRQRPGGITGAWSLRASVYVDAAFVTTTGPVVQSELWGHTGTTDAGGDYLIVGFSNASPTDPRNAAATDRAFRFQVYDGSLGGYVEVELAGDFAFDAWHTLGGISRGTAFDYYLDDQLIYSAATLAGEDLLSVMIQGYNFSETGGYSVHWDNVTATAIPEPATTVLLAAVMALGGVIWRRRRLPPRE